MHALDTAELRKARGAFFTPEEVARFIVEWTVRTPTDVVLEPSCGEAAFLAPVGSRLAELGAERVGASQLHGVELHEPSAENARILLAGSGFGARITVSDFFDADLAPEYDAVVGNPPYVRYQDFRGESRAKSQRAALAAGVRLTNLSSSWAAFVVQSAQLVKAGGRLGLVLPAELLSVNYAAPVRSFLLRRFSSVRLVVFSERVFPGVLEEIVILLAEGQGPSDSIAISQAQNLDDLASLAVVKWTPPVAEAKWTPALLSAEQASTYSELASELDFTLLESWGSVDLGMVTGNNRYFTLCAADAWELGLNESDLLRISPPGSRHLRGLSISDAAWAELRELERRTYLFVPDREHPSAAARRYIKVGEEAAVHEAYKCRVRNPWWRVPLVRVPDLFLTYMNHDAPRLVTNEARLLYLNSVHGVTLKPPVRALGRDLLPIGLLNSLSLLGAELVGRSYGGGLLKVEPKEGDLIPVPSPETLRAIAPSLKALRPQLATHLRAGDLNAAVKLVDRVLLVEHHGLKRQQVASLRASRASLFDRRASRAVS